jgi:hypothetical protein
MASGTTSTPPTSGAFDFSEAEVAALGLDLLLTLLGALVGMLTASLLNIEGAGNPFTTWHPLLLCVVMTLVIFALLVLRRIGVKLRQQHPRIAAAAPPSRDSPVK